MRTTILAFGAAKDIFGGHKVEIDLPERARVTDLKALLGARYPLLAQLAVYRIAINDEYAADEDEITEGDEVAVIPPVSGG